MGKSERLPKGQSQYMVVGRFVPNQKYTEGHPQCKVYRMKLFAKNAVVARSRYWYFMKRLTRVKKANGQIISVNQARLSPAAAAPAGSGRGRRSLKGWGVAAARSSPVLPVGPGVTPRLFAADLREEPDQGQELRLLVPVRVAYWHAQRLQGVPLHEAYGRCELAL